MLNSSDNSGYPCLVPDFHGNASGFIPLSKMLWFELVMYVYNHIKLLSIDYYFTECFFKKL